MRGPGKKFAIAAEHIQRLIEPPIGACFASDEITVRGRKVGFMYREEPESDLDSGWRFLAGNETPAYMADPNNFGLYDVNTIANYDREIIRFLDSPPGTSFGRASKNGPLVQETADPPAGG